MKAGSSASSSSYDKRSTATLRDGASNGAWVTFSNLEPDTRYAFYCEIEDSSGNLLISLDDTEYTLAPEVDASIRSFSLSSLDVGQRDIEFEYDIDDWNDNVYGVLLIRRTDESSAGEDNIGYLDDSGYFTYTTSRYGNFYASLRITDGRNGDALDEISCDTRPIRINLDWNSFDYGSYPGEKSAYFEWAIERPTSDAYYIVYYRLAGESSYGSTELSYSATSYTFHFDRTGTIEAHIVLYHDDSGGEILRYPSSGDVELESSAPEPIVSNFRASSNYGEMSADFSWSAVDIRSTDYFRIYFRHETDPVNSYSSVRLSYDERSYSYDFTRTGTYYCHIVLYDSSGDELSRSPNSGDISVESTYSITGFSWTSSELDAFENNGKTTELTRTRWNEFIDYVNRCVDYFAAANGESYSKLSSSVKMGSDKVMYADSFIEVCEKINEITESTMSGITLSRIEPGAEIKGAYFPYMLDYLQSHM